MERQQVLLVGTVQAEDHRRASHTGRGMFKKHAVAQVRYYIVYTREKSVR